MDVVKVIKETKNKAGYIIRDEEWLTHFEDKPKGHTQLMKNQAYNMNNEWIGDSKWAHRLIVQRGIMPEKRDPSHCVCSIGFNVKKQKWYGWSHRAIYGFGIGSTCKKGDCNYHPANKKDFIEDCILFWNDENHIQTTGIEKDNGVQVEWLYNNKIKNKKLRGTINSIFTEYPTSWGRGEWTAKTLNDAKQMAIDFAEGVS